MLLYVFLLLCLLLLLCLFDEDDEVQVEILQLSQYFRHKAYFYSKDRYLEENN